MIFLHANSIKKDGKFTFSGKVEAFASSALNSDIIKDFWHGYTFRTSELEIKETKELVFKIGEAEVIDSGDSSYSINICETGIAVSAKNEKDLIYGFVTMLDLIKMDDNGEKLEVACQTIKESCQIERRMVHYCVFAQTKLWEIERFIRLCGALKFTHIVIEFWGMLKYDCLKELAWENGFTKEEIRPLIKMANDLGIEIIPMINHWGHAASCRMTQGKHVVLNQNPSLQYLFSEEGWRWNIGNPKTKALLKAMRSEICELCGNGEYFHIGCDEAYGFDFSRESMDEICDYLNEICEELALLGRRAVMWGDMLLYKRPEFKNNAVYYASCKDLECEKYMTYRLDKRIIIADWQYEVKNAPVETAVKLKNDGFDTMLAPWDMGNGLSACAKTVRDEKLYGLMHTTWHTLSRGCAHVVRAAQHGWAETPEIGEHFWSTLRTHTAALLRKVYFTDGDYTKSGWADYEIEVYT